MGGARHIVKHGKNKGQTAKRLIALSVCAVFIAVSLLSATFVFTHTTHKHDRFGPDGNCATCTRLAEAAYILESICIAMAGAAFFLWGFLMALPAPTPVSFYRGFRTLVFLKVRLNN